MPNPDEFRDDPEVTRRIRETFAPQPRELPGLDERFKELERKVRELEAA